MPDGGEHLRPREPELHRSSHHAGRERGKDDMRPRPEPRPERAADVGREHADVVLGQPEDLRERLADTVGPLGRVVDRKPVAVPSGDGRKEAERIVGFVYLYIFDGCRAPGETRPIDRRRRRGRYRGGARGGTYAGPLPELETTRDYMGLQTEAQGQQPQRLCGRVLSALPPLPRT